MERRGLPGEEDCDGKRREGAALPNGEGDNAARRKGDWREWRCLQGRKKTAPPEDEGGSDARRGRGQCRLVWADAGMASVVVMAEYSGETWRGRIVGDNFQRTDYGERRGEGGGLLKLDELLRQNLLIFDHWQIWPSRGGIKRCMLSDDKQW